MRPVEVDRVMINLVSGARGNSYSMNTERGGESRTSRHVMVEVPDKVVPDNVVVAGGYVDAVTAKGTRASAVDCGDLIFSDRSRSRGARDCSGDSYTSYRLNVSDGIFGNRIGSTCAADDNAVYGGGCSVVNDSVQRIVADGYCARADRGIELNADHPYGDIRENVLECV